MTLRDAVLAAIDAMEACGFPYMLVGAFSSNVYGIDRATKDVDIVIELGEASILRLGPHLPPNIRLDPQMTFETVTMTRRFIAHIQGSPFEIEFFLVGNDPHDVERFRRRTPAPYLDRTVFLPTPEDVIITKLRWARPKDLDDVRNVIAVQGDENLDWPYIHAWCAQHDTREALDRIRASIPPI